MPSSIPVLHVELSTSQCQHVCSQRVVPGAPGSPDTQPPPARGTHSRHAPFPPSLCSPPEVRTHRYMYYTRRPIHQLVYEPCSTASWAQAHISVLALSACCARLRFLQTSSGAWARSGSREQGSNPTPPPALLHPSAPRQVWAGAQLHAAAAARSCPHQRGRRWGGGQGVSGNPCLSLPAASPTQLLSQEGRVRAGAAHGVLRAPWRCWRSCSRSILAFTFESGRQLSWRWRSF